jgi:hypothetical protein
MSGSVVAFDPITDVTRRDAVLELVAASMPSWRDDADLLVADSAHRPPGLLCGLLVPSRAGGVVFVDAETREASLGWFSATDRRSGVAVIRAARRLASAAGATSLVGPRNISTWRRYRCVVDEPADAPPPFLLEPMSPPLVQQCCERSGGEVVRRYATLRVAHIEVARTAAAVLRARADGVVFEALEARSDDAFVDVIHTLADAFAHKTGFRPTTRAHVDFLYRDTRAVLTPGLSFVALRDGVPLGFVVAWPDHSGPTLTTVVKTLGVRPGAPAFLGWALMHEHVQHARAHGATHGLYALMEKAAPLLRYASAPRRMGDDVASVYRRYALYRWRC